MVQQQQKFREWIFLEILNVIDSHCGRVHTAFHRATAEGFSVLLQSLIFLYTCFKDFSPDRISKEIRSNVIPDQSRKKVNFAEELAVGIYDGSEPPVTPLQTRAASLTESAASGSQLRSVLKKTPVKQLMDCVKVG